MSSSVACSGPRDRKSTSTASGYDCGRCVASAREMCRPLNRLKDDPSTMVRRSVANNLNDLGKSNPELLFRIAGAWLEEGAADRRALVEHALRSAVKRGAGDALRLLGYGRKAAVAIEDVRISPRRVSIGGRVSVGFALRSRSRASQDLLVDMTVHFVKASGRSAPKVFKLKRVMLPAGGRAEFARS